MSGALIQLYAVGSSGDGSAAKPLTSSPVYTASDGSFSIDTYQCPNDDIPVYLLSTGGNPGLGTGGNSAIQLMAALGSCGSVATLNWVVINEESTVAAAGVLGPYIQSPTAIGYGPSDVSAFSTAFASIAAFVSVSSGLPPGPAVPAGYSVPIQKLNTLADVVADCVNSPGGTAYDGSLCGNLFALVTTLPVPPPSDTFGAALAIAKNPAHNVAAIFDAVGPIQPFEPVLPAPPADWQLTLLPTASTPTISPATGIYTSAQTIVISDVSPGATIHYTLDGSTPTPSSPVYTTPFTVAATTTVQAVGFINGFASGVLSATITIQPSSPTKLAFVTAPVTATVGSSIAPALAVAVEDALGNLVTTGTYTVTLTLAANGAGSPLSGTLTAKSTNGIAIFSDVVVGISGSGYQLAAAAAGLAPAVSSGFSVNGLGSVAVNAYWTRPGNADSPLNLPLSSSETLVPVPVGFSGLQSDLSSWFAPAASSPGLWQAATSDPKVLVLFNISSWDNVHSGIWLRQNNTPAVEAQILATSSPTYQLPPVFGIYSKYYYMTTSIGGSGWIPPSPPALNPQTAPPAGGLRVYAPQRALPASDSDGYFAIFQPDGTVLECYSGIVLSSGTIVCGTYNVTHSWSNLLGSEGGIMASTVPVYAGLIRQTDIDAGVIAHGLSICISATQLGNAFVSPAVSFDRDSGYSGTLPMGSRLAIPLSVNLGAHVFQSRVGAIIAHAAQTYGAFLLDRGGPNGFTIRAEKNMTDPAFTNTWDWSTQQDLSWILSQLQLVNQN